MYIPESQSDFVLKQQRSSKSILLEIRNGQVCAMHVQYCSGMLESGALQLVSQREASATFSFIVTQGPLIRIELALFAFTL